MIYIIRHKYIFISLLKKLTYFFTEWTGFCCIVLNEYMVPQKVTIDFSYGKKNNFITNSKCCAELWSKYAFLIIFGPVNLSENLLCSIVCTDCIRKVAYRYILLYKWVPLAHQVGCFLSPINFIAFVIRTSHCLTLSIQK